MVLKCTGWVWSFLDEIIGAMEITTGVSLVMLVWVCKATAGFELTW